MIRAIAGYACCQPLLPHTLHYATATWAGRHYEIHTPHCYDEDIIIGDIKMEMLMTLREIRRYARRYAAGVWLLPAPLAATAAEGEARRHTPVLLATPLATLLVTCY